MESMNIAERCYDRATADDELFDTLQTLLGGRPSDECLDPGFQWMINTCWVDSYDGSVEVVLAAGAPRLTREAADKVLALGFDQIYENAPGEPYATVWTRAGCWPQGAASKHREAGERWEVAKLRARVAQLERQLAGT